MRTSVLALVAIAGMVIIVVAAAIATVVLVLPGPPTRTMIVAISWPR
ncbi:hypothetical protein [Nonomuraea guangzhouensis]|uniref:Uncharacterized protein n=1 Tax=Nonomuraea guangzhouensis TaxID=1291555 RepID=A0ABW4GXY0_9ACTN|nr:hypothetical protein [Nonomuraea guangzhouensis]